MVLLCLTICEQIGCPVYTALCHAAIVDNQSSVRSAVTNLALWPDVISRAGAGRRLLLGWPQGAAASQIEAFF